MTASSFEEAVRLAVSLGGDADTQAAIAGAVAEPLFGGVPEAIAAPVLARLTPAMRDVHERFRARVADRQWRRSDPATIPRDHPPPVNQRDE